MVGLPIKKCGAVGYALIGPTGTIDPGMIATKAKILRRWVDNIYGVPWGKAKKYGYKIIKVKVIPYAP